MTPTAVLVHGWPVTEHHWRLLRPRLEAEGIAAVAWSPPGLGVPASLDQPLDKRSIAAMLARWLEERRLARAILIGHDWGGTICWMLSRERPELVAALVVEEEILPGVAVTIPEPGANNYPSWHGPFNRAIGLAEALVPGRERAYFGQFLRESAGPARLEADVVERYIAAYSAPGILDSGLGYYRTHDRDIADVRVLEGATATVPTLAIGGRHAMGAAVAAGLRRESTLASEVVLDSSGHYPAEQQPDAVADAITRFVAIGRKPT